jgi:hypothetical protein
VLAGPQPLVGGPTKVGATFLPHCPSPTPPPAATLFFQTCVLASFTAPPPLLLFLRVRNSHVTGGFLSWLLVQGGPKC